MTTTATTTATATPAGNGHSDDVHPRRLEQARKGAALLLPTIAFYAPVAHFGIDFTAWALLASAAYLLAVLHRVALSPRRRRWALGVTATGLAAETTLLMMSDHDLGLQAALFCAVPVAYVAAWGIARRANPRWWKTGLPLAAITAIIPVRAAALAWTASGHLLVASLWLSSPGVVALGCLVCWAIDIHGGRSHAGAHHH